MNYYRRFPADYANDTRHLDFIQHGAYTLLLDHCYTTEKPLPPDVSEIQRLMCARTTQEKLAVESVLKEFFQLGRWGYAHKRVKSEIALCNAKKDVLRANGRKGGLSKIANAKQLPSKSLAFQTLDSRLYTLEPEKPTSKPTPRFAWPDWIRTDSWEAFEEMRKKIRAPLTDRARQGIVRELEKLRPENEANEVLLQSVTRAWRGVFPIHTNGNGSQQETNADVIRRAFRKSAS